MNIFADGEGRTQRAAVPQRLKMLPSNQKACERPRNSRNEATANLNYCKVRFPTVIPNASRKPLTGWHRAILDPAATAWRGVAWRGGGGLRRRKGVYVCIYHGIRFKTNCAISRSLYLHCGVILLPPAGNVFISRGDLLRARVPTCARAQRRYLGADVKLIHPGRACV
ncbi:hypothetical protein EVAR_48639_1 [Eumeta japonica]|uniref:Uncharacterized protein n=1 Tax=Eumeta variegata TaxID=151549 RepID=A0A4C1XQA2_EUMVA|nr:hypothetical protein EVAR_48639_1 [Eumeta japonica]